jgi:hypothetical protein
MSVSSGIGSNFEARNSSPFHRGALKAQSRNHGCRGVPPESEAEQLDSVVLKVVAAQSVGDAPGLDRLVMVAGYKHDLFRGGVLEPALEWPGQERVLRPKIALGRERDVAGNHEKVARRDGNQVLVQIGDANNVGHRERLAGPIVASGLERPAGIRTSWRARRRVPRARSDGASRPCARKRRAPGCAPDHAANAARLAAMSLTSSIVPAATAMTRS